MKFLLHIKINKEGIIMFKRHLAKRKNRLKRLKAIRSLISRKRCENEKIEKLRKEVDILIASIK